MSKIVYTRETTNDNIGAVETFYEAQADELSGEALSPYFESSESVTKSLNQSGNIEFSVNADMVQKVDRAVLTPASAPSEDVVPVVDSTNAVSYKPLSEIGGGGGGGGFNTISFSTIAQAHTWAMANLTKIEKMHIGMENFYLYTFTNVNNAYGSSEIKASIIEPGFNISLGNVESVNIVPVRFTLTETTAQIVAGGIYVATADGTVTASGNIRDFTDEMLAEEGVSIIFTYVD